MCLILIVNGKPWSSAEIAALVQAVERQQCLAKLATRLNRTEAAVISKARKLQLKPQGGDYIANESIAKSYAG